MIKTLLWVVSNDGRFFQGALKILEQQHNGIELVDTAAGEDISAVDAVGGCMTFCLSSVQNKSA